MALTRKFLKAMGIEDEKIDQIIEAHAETVSGLKDSLEKAEADAKTLSAVQTELEETRADLETMKKDGWEDKYNNLKKEFEDYKTEITANEAKAAKETAARAYYESKGITGKALDIAIRGSRAEINALELDKSGEKAKDYSGLEALVNGDFSGLVGQTHTEGAKTATPPVNVAGKRTMTKEEIMNIKDIDARHKAIAENGELFGIT